MPPMPPDFLQQLLARRDTWWGRESTGTGQGQSTGFNDLDRILAGGGWPEQGLVELLCPLPCPAVLHLLLPVLFYAVLALPLLLLLLLVLLPLAA